MMNHYKTHEQEGSSWLYSTGTNETKEQSSDQHIIYILAKNNEKNDTITSTLSTVVSDSHLLKLLVFFFRQVFI